MFPFTSYSVKVCYQFNKILLQFFRYTFGCYTGVWNEEKIVIYLEGFSCIRGCGPILRGYAWNWFGRKIVAPRRERFSKRRDYSNCWNFQLHLFNLHKTPAPFFLLLPPCIKTWQTVLNLLHSIIKRSLYNEEQEHLNRRKYIHLRIVKNKYLINEKTWII